MSFYDECIREAVENNLISKSYQNPLYIGLAANYETEPFLTVKKKISLGEIFEGEFGFPKDVELSIINALVNEKRISKASSLRLIALFNSKRLEISSAKQQRLSEMREWRRAQEEKKITKDREDEISLNKVRKSMLGQSLSCPSCNATVSSEAFTCPQCGHPLRYAATRSGFGCLGFAFLLIVVPTLIILFIF